MKKLWIGLSGGIIGAIINIVPLLLAPNIDIEVYYSTAITWIAIGILISICNLKCNGILKGIVVTILVSASSFIYTAAASFIGSIWTAGFALIAGAIIGYIIDKLSQR